MYFISIVKSSLHSAQDLCKQFHQKIDVVDEERYDMSIKVAKSDKEVFLFLIPSSLSISLLYYGFNFQHMTLCVLVD